MRGRTLYVSSPRHTTRWKWGMRCLSNISSSWRQLGLAYHLPPPICDHCLLHSVWHLIAAFLFHLTYLENTMISEMGCQSDSDDYEAMDYSSSVPWVALAVNEIVSKFQRAGKGRSATPFVCLCVCAMWHCLMMYLSILKLIGIEWGLASSHRIRMKWGYHRQEVR